MAYWIPAALPLRLAIMARPRGGDWLVTEVTRLKHEGADILASLLTREEEAELDLLEERAACEQAGMEFRQFSIPDRQTPDKSPQFRTFAGDLYQDARQGRAIVAHCRAGIGRSSLLLASLLVQSGYPAEHAFAMISAARGFPVPDTPEQIDWVRQFARNWSHPSEAID